MALNPFLLMSANEHEPSSQQPLRPDRSGSFESAKSFLEGSPRADCPPSGDKGGDAERQRQLKLLASWAEREGKLIPADRWMAPIEMGAEHRVFLDEERSCAIKITNTGKCGMTYREGEPAAASAMEYLERWILHNEVFNDQVWLEGVVVGPSGISLAVGQPWIEGDVPSPEMILEQMCELGFAPTALHESYFRERDGIAVLDCHEGNFILGLDGILYPIDLVVVTADEALMARMEVIP